MSRKTDAGYEEWVRSLGVMPDKLPPELQKLFREKIYDRHIALGRGDFVCRLNSETRTALRRAELGLGRITTNQTVQKWVAAGLPLNADGTVSPLEVCAFLASDRKDAGGGRKSAGEKAASGGMKKKLSGDSLSERMRSLVEGGDVVGLIGLLMEFTDDLPTAEAVSKIVCNVINAEKGRVKAQSDDYERRIRGGELLEASEVEAGRIARVQFIRETLEGLGGYAPRLQGKNVSELQESLEQIGRELLYRLAGEDDGR